MNFLECTQRVFSRNTLHGVPINTAVGHQSLPLFFSISTSPHLLHNLTEHYLGKYLGNPGSMGL